MRRLVLGGEDQRHIEIRTQIGCRHQLLDREIFNAENTHGTGYVAEVGAREFVTGGPRRQHAGHGVACLHEILGMLVQQNVIAVGEIVLNRKSVRRIDEQRGHKASATIATTPRHSRTLRLSVETKRMITSGTTGSM